MSWRGRSPLAQPLIMWRKSQSLRLHLSVSQHTPSLHISPSQDPTSQSLSPSQDPPSSSLSPFRCHSRHPLMHSPMLCMSSRHVRGPGSPECQSRSAMPGGWHSLYRTDRTETASLWEPSSSWKACCRLRAGCAMQGSGRQWRSVLHAHTHTHTHTHTYTHMHACTHTYTHACTHTRTEHIAGGGGHLCRGSAAGSPPVHRYERRACSPPTPHRSAQHHWLCCIPA